jgi:hypothetical protein
MGAGTRIYKAMPTEECEFCQPIGPNRYDLLRDALECGGTQGAGAIPEVRLFRVDERKELERADLPWLDSGAMVLTPPAVDALGPILSEHGELCALPCKQARLVVFKCRVTLDALDEGGSTIDRFMDGRIMNVDKYVFRKGVVEQAVVFRLKGLGRASELFYGQQIVDQVQKHKLRGMEFDQVWAG